MQQFYKCWIVMVDNLAMPHIKYSNLLHFFFRQAKVPYINVLFHPVLMHRFRNNYYTPLYIPAKYNLCCAFAIFFSDLCQHRICKNTMLPFCKWSPCLRLHAILFHQGKRIPLLEEWMQFYLVDRRNHFDCLANIHKYMGITVAHTNSLEYSLLIRFFHRTISANVIPHRLVYQIKINIIKPQFV